MSIQPIDIVLLLVSVAACGYCAILSRRLRALQDTKDGLGATILALSKTIAAVSSSTDDARDNAGNLAKHLADLMKDADATCVRALETSKTLDSRAAKLEAQSAQSVSRASSVQTELNALMDDIRQQSEDRMLEITKVMRRHTLESQTEISSALKDSIDQSKVQIRELQALLGQLRSLKQDVPKPTNSMDTLAAIQARTQKMRG